MLTPEQIQANWTKFTNTIQQYISGERGIKLLDFYIAWITFLEQIRIKILTVNASKVKLNFFLYKLVPALSEFSLIFVLKFLYINGILELPIIFYPI